MSSGVRWLGPAGWLGLAGLALGVACLIVAMAVVSGYESTLKRNVADVTSHIQVIQTSSGRGEDEQEKRELPAKLKAHAGVQAVVPYLFAEAVVAHSGKVSGAYVYGVPWGEVDQVLGLRSRLLAGEFDLPIVLDPQRISVLVGKALAQNYNLTVGSEFRLVVPLPSENPANFRRKIVELKVRGILDLGKVEYDERMVVADLSSVQEAVAVGRGTSGYLLHLQNIDSARALSLVLSDELRPNYRVRDWLDINENLFAAAKIEKFAIFFIIFVIVVAAAFNVSISLYVNVFARSREIAVLKTMGLSSHRIRRVFSLQGFLVGGLGSALGVLLGFLFCWVFSFLETTFGLLPASVYRIDRIDVHIRPLEVLIICVAALVLSWLSALAPAARGAKLSAAEGVRRD